MERKKLLLLHGWDWKKYPVFSPRHQWENRQEFVDRLQADYEVDFPSLPGFKRNEAARVGSWTLDDYADWLQKEMTSKHYDAVVGYSFGCAVATRWQYRYRDKTVPLVLVSPAITRAYRNHPSKTLSAFARALKGLLGANAARKFRSLYLTYWIRNPFVTNGSPFLQSTYSNIVVVNLADDLRELLTADFPITLVFGSEDTATPESALLALVPEARPVTRVIPGGTHEIGSTHGPELVAHISSSLAHVNRRV